MAALPEAATLTTANDLTQSQIFDPYLYNYPATAFRLMGNIRPLSSGKGPAGVLPRMQQIAVPAGTKTETDLFGEDSATTDAESITVAYFGVTLPVSREILHDASTDVRQLIASEGVRALEDRIEADGFGLATSCTNTQGAVTDVWNRVKLTAAKAAAIAVIQPQPGEQLVLAVGPTGATELEADEVLTAATSMPSNFVQHGPPIMGQYGSLVLLQTPHIPTNSTGHEAVMTVAGKRSGLVMLVAEPISIGLDVLEQRKVVWLTVAIRAGFGIGKQDNILSVLGH